MDTQQAEPVSVWKWRIVWAGRRVTSSTWMTEAEVRREHPEAERIDSTHRLRPPPIPESEWKNNMHTIRSGLVRDPDGTMRYPHAWERSSGSGSGPEESGSV